jgi:hypothetical protein
MNRHWVKLWIKAIDDAALATLPDSEWRLAIECFLVAGENGNDGKLPKAKELAWRLRRDIDTMLAMLDVLIIAGIITKEQDDYIVTNFTKRQSAVTGAERQRKYKQINGDGSSLQRQERRQDKNTDKRRRGEKKKATPKTNNKLTRYLEDAQ